MKIVHTDASYKSGGGRMNFDYDYDFLLFRQDWNGTENVFFNKEEIDVVLKKIYRNEILIHNNYSILYAKDKELLQIIEMPCYKLVWNEG